MTLFGTRRQPVAEPTPAIKAETCVACGRDDGAPMNLIPVPGYEMQWVCVEPAQCRQRAQLAGVYGVTR